jgi:hypothetical protein
MADQVPPVSQTTNENAHILQPQARSAQRERPLVLGAAPAIDLESTDGSGNGSPVDGSNPIVPAPMGRMDSSQTWSGLLSPDLNAMDQHNHAVSTSPSIYAEIQLGPFFRPPPVS